eukprot:TRINITY_DN1039_c0_g1_i2.p1 TRINITY_DN1039_c0_g1~~TRINITY_DN1039_c0_g1_i2.p1  ORF type:complete len:412 (+),score=65.96 TRINITY_DN1039_c0_g1_i2:150-1238(+)
MSASASFNLGTSIVLILLCYPPILNAFELLYNSNYSFFVGPTIPKTMIVLCTGICVLYMVGSRAILSLRKIDWRDDVMVATLTISTIALLGVVLMLISLPIARQSGELYNNLMHRCDFNEQSHRLVEYSQVLHNIRVTPECAKRISIEDCDGYDEAPPYTTFLKAMEEKFQCSGFCHMNPQKMLSLLDPPRTNTSLLSRQAIATEHSRSETSMIEGQTVGDAPHPRHVDHVVPISLLGISSREVGRAVGRAVTNEDKGFVTSNHGEAPKAALAHLSSVFRESASTMYPPTLFSDANFQASCEGMLARDMSSVVGDVAFQAYYQGLYLLVLALLLWVFKMIGLSLPPLERKHPRFADELVYGA